MYVVLIAMLALQISSDVLRGFTVIDEGLTETLAQQRLRNDSLYQRLSSFATHHETKAMPWLKRADSIRSLGAGIASQVNFLKEEMVLLADGAEGCVDSVLNGDDQEAAAQVMLSPVLDYGKDFVDSLNCYFKMLERMQVKRIEKNRYDRTWLSKSFEMTPLTAALTLLTKVELDVALMEGEALNRFCMEMDRQDIRINRYEAVVIPESYTVLKNCAYKARIVLSGVDSTKKPRFYEMRRDKVAAIPLTDGKVKRTTENSGEHRLFGEMVMLDNEGREQRVPFASTYMVIEPNATVASDLTRVLYAGIQNPLSVSVPGVAPQEIRMTASEGALEKTGEGGYLILPDEKAVGKEIILSVYAMDQLVKSLPFKVRALPAPVPFWAYQDKNKGTVRFQGGKIKRSDLSKFNELQATIDDGILDIPYRVLSFEMVLFDAMGNAVPMASEDARFSDAQRKAIRQLGRNQRFYISKIKVADRKGKQQVIHHSMEVIVL